MGRAENERVEAAISGSRISNGKYRASCPFCEDEGHRDAKTSLVVDSDTGRWFCYRCNERGRLPGGVVDALETTTPKRTAKPSEPTTFAPPDAFLELDDPVARASSVYEQAIEYIASRGIKPAAVRTLRIGACADGEWSGRVLVPHLDGDTWLGWVGRVWVQKPPPGVLVYRYPPGMRRTLFNSRVLLEKTDEPALAFEGALDVAHYHRRSFGFFGSPTPSHVEEIVEKSKRPVAIVLDGDAHEKGHMLALKLQTYGVPCGAVTLGPRIDPDEVPRKDLLAAAKACIGKWDAVRV